MKENVVVILSYPVAKERYDLFTIQYRSNIYMLWRITSLVMAWKVLNSENLTNVCEARNAQATLVENPQMIILSFHNNNMDILLILDQKSL